MALGRGLWQAGGGGAQPGFQTFDNRVMGELLHMFLAPSRPPCQGCHPWARALNLEQEAVWGWDSSWEVIGWGVFTWGGRGLNRPGLSTL